MLFPAALSRFLHESHPIQMCFRFHVQGLATLRMLWQLQDRTGRQIHELFDLICGTSTGGILAAALAARRVPLSECEDIYRCANDATDPQCHPGTLGSRVEQEPISRCDEC